MVDRREFRFEFPCPGCQARLRLQDRALIGTRWNCPECQIALDIRDSGNGDLTAKVADKAPPKPIERGIKLRTATALVAITLISGVAVFALWPPSAPPAPPTVSPPAAPPTPVQVTTAPVVPPTAPLDPVEAQLTAMGRWLNGQYATDGAFPAGVVPSELPIDERMSWLSRFREETDTAQRLIPDQTHSWKDPANEPFVRRRASGLLNPRVAAVASDDGYPASHYVGVAGVGADAPELPKSHPRAGVFGIDRRTTREDIQDGTSNTLMVVGVQDHPPPWANGVRSLQGLTAEPYIGGPDHLGTGQADGMLVLLADGSVKFLSKETDPKVMRRMAAMADGLPLDASVPGEPADPVSIDPPVPAVEGGPPVSQPADPPIAVEVAPEQNGFDVEKGLAVSVSRFQIKTPIPLRQVLRQIVEMSALPIDPGDLQDDPRLDQLVSIDIEKSTLREVLGAVLKQVQLEYIADSQGIHLRPSESPAAPITNEAKPASSEPSP